MSSEVSCRSLLNERGNCQLSFASEALTFSSFLPCFFSTHSACLSTCVFSPVHSWLKSQLNSIFKDSLTSDCPCWMICPACDRVSSSYFVASFLYFPLSVGSFSVYPMHTVVHSWHTRCWNCKGKERKEQSMILITADPNCRPNSRGKIICGMSNHTHRHMDTQCWVTSGEIIAHWSASWVTACHFCVSFCSFVHLSFSPSLSQSRQLNTRLLLLLSFFPPLLSRPVSLHLPHSAYFFAYSLFLVHAWFFVCVSTRVISYIPLTLQLSVIMRISLSPSPSLSLLTFTCGILDARCLLRCRMRLSILFPFSFLTRTHQEPDERERERERGNFFSSPSQ